MADRIGKRNNILKALAGSSGGQNIKETLLSTYNVLGNLSKSMLHQSGSTNASDLKLQEDTNKQRIMQF